MKFSSRNICKIVISQSVCIRDVFFLIGSYILYFIHVWESIISICIMSCQEMQSWRDVIIYWRGAREKKKQSLRSTTSLVPFSVSIFQTRYLVLSARSIERETTVLVLHDECLSCFRQTLFPLLPLPHYIYARKSRSLAHSHFSKN